MHSSRKLSKHLHVTPSKKVKPALSYSTVIYHRSSMYRDKCSEIMELVLIMRMRKLRVENMRKKSLKMNQAEHDLGKLIVEGRIIDIKISV